MLLKKFLYKQKYDQDDMPGYDAISDKEKSIYGTQEPMHWATILPYELGGTDPLWAVDGFISSAPQHFHYVTSGFSSLYFNPDLVNDKVSGFGFEITFRHFPFGEDIERPFWAVNFLQNIAKYVFKTDNGFDDYQYMSANGPIRAETVTEITAFAFCTDKEMGTINTPHGAVKFLQLYGLTTNEYNSIRNKEYTVKELLSEHMIKNPLLITDLNRK